MNITKVGISADYPEFLQRKIAISNMIALVIAFMVALPFVFISLIFFAPLAYLPVVAIPIALSTIFFNYLKLHTLARTIISLVPVCLASVYQAYLSTRGEPVIPGMAMIMISFSFVIFVIFDLKEKFMLTLMSAVVLIILLLMDPLNEVLEMPLDTKIIETGFLAKLVIIISTISGAGCILILAFQNSSSERKAFDLLRESEANQQAMAAKELELKDNLLKLEEAQKEERKRQWVNEGIAKGIIILREQSDIEKLADELIAFVVKYVKANQGALFIMNDTDIDNPFLELTAAYAYDRKKYVQKRIDIGEGLVGQTFLEKSTMYIKVVPKDYMHITSGMGDALPRTLLIVPLKINGTVPALIELASFQEFEDYQIQFLETFGENIASHLQSARINATTQTLLATSQQQAEEMKAQEEEMRQNMEELSATQEEMTRKEQEYLRRIADLEKQVKVIER